MRKMLGCRVFITYRKIRVVNCGIKQRRIVFWAVVRYLVGQ